MAARKDAAADLDKARATLAGAEAGARDAAKAAVAAAEAKLAAAQKSLDEAEKSLRERKIDDFAKLLMDDKLRDERLTEAQQTPSPEAKGRKIPENKARELAALHLGDPGPVKPYARLATWPWFEDRGPNPYLMATGQLGKPWETGHFWDWLLTQQTPVLLEPIVKLLLPVVYLFHPGADWWCEFYFLCVLIWAVLTWSVFGGAITRIAAVQVARGEKISALEALNFTRKRIGSYVAAPMIPLAILVLLVIGMILYGFPLMIPIFGDIVVAGLFWPLMIVVGLLLAITLVGLVGWPFMSVTISARAAPTSGTPSRRAYSYVYQKPWHFIWYTAVAVVYGAVVIFFIGFMGSLTIYLAKWGVSYTPGMAAARPAEPSFLFVDAPTSYQWRPLLLRGATVATAEQIVGADDQINDAAFTKWMGRDSNYNALVAPNTADHPDDRLAWYNLIGAFLVAIWLYIMFLLILGFSYSYFWSASTIVYLLMRRKVDGEDMDEVTLEDENESGFAGAPLGSPTAAPPTGVKPGATTLTMVDAPSLRPPIPPPTTAPPPPAVAPAASGGVCFAGPTWPAPSTEDGAAPHTEVGARAEGAVAVRDTNRKSSGASPMGLIGLISPIRPIEAPPVGEDRRWRGRSSCSPASGPTCRWRSWRRRSPSGATRGWNCAAGAITSRSSAPSARTITARTSWPCSIASS